MWKKESLGRKTFIIINGLLLLLLTIITLYPLLYVVFASFSNANAFMAHDGILLYPLKPTIAAYTATFRNSFILTGYRNTIFVVVVGTALNMVMTTVAAYFFSRKNVRFQKFLLKIVMFTMYFNGGLIPTYLWIKQLGLLDNLLALIIPGAIATTNMIILRTAFYNVPESLEESAKLDGAGHFVLLTRIIIPLIMPTLAVIALYYSVGHWNAWFNASIYISSKTLYPLQLVLREILITNDTSAMLDDVALAEQAYISETIKYAVIVVSTVPILCLYPFLQRYFVQGVMIGAVKE